MKIQAASIALALVCAAGTANAQFWRVGSNNGLSNSISDNGVMVGDSGAGAGGEYYMWTAGTGTVGIGGATAGNGIGGQPTISNDGLHVGGTVFNAAENWYEMGRYDVTSGTWTGFGQLPVIGQQIDASVGSGWAISGDGQTVGGLAWTTEGTADTHAVLYNATTGWNDLGTNAVGQSARVNAINFDSTVVGGWQDGAGRQGAVWVNGVQQLIVDNNGGAAQEVFAVSDDGAYATGFGLGGFFSAAESYRYDIANDVYELIPNLLVGAESRMAGAAINGDGTLIGGGTWGIGPATFGRGFIWEEGVGTMTVTDYLDSKGVAYESDFFFSFVSGMSSDGKWLTGWGYNEAAGLGATEAWVIRVPAPSGVAMLGLAGLCAARRRRH